MTSNDSYTEQEFERGHKNGLFMHRCENYTNAEFDIDGYRSAVEQRDHDSSHRQHSGHHDCGYRKVHDYEFTSLAGWRRELANDKMSDLGFRDVDDFKKINTRYWTGYIRSTGQFVQGTYANSSLVSMNDIRTHPACR